MINLRDYIDESRLFKTIEVDELLLVQYECFINEHRSDIWSHTNYFSFVEGGRKKWKTASSEYLVKSGDILFVKKGAHTVYQYFEDPFFVLFVFVPDDFIVQTLHEFKDYVPMAVSRDLPARDLYQVETSKVLNSFRDSLLAFFEKEAIVSKAIIKLKIKELIITLLTQPGNQVLKSLFVGLNQDRNTSLIQIMNASFNQPLSIEDFARLCSRSLSSFRRDFKEVFHQTPGRWLIHKRLEYSRFLLETTDQTVNEVVDNCGFKNRSHFLKAFKENFHLTPSSLRNRIRR